MYLTRTLKSWFKEASLQFPVLLVTGAARSASAKVHLKSTCLLLWTEE